MTGPDTEYAELLARAAPYLNRPPAAGDDADGAGYGRVAVHGDAWLRNAAEPYLRGDALPELDLDPDEAAEALLVAFDELVRDAALEGAELRAWDPGKHPRGPDGRFRSTVDSLKASIARHRKAGKGGDPFDGFDREQLRKAARARGIELKRGEDRDSIAAKLLADLDQDMKAAPAAPKAVGRAGIPPATAAGKFHRNLNGVADLADVVERGKVVKQRRLAGGAIGDTRRKDYEDGTSIVWKRSKDPHDSDAEQLASLVGRSLGLQAPRVYRNRPDTVNMEFVADGRPAIDVLGMTGIQHLDEKYLDSDEGVMMGLLDQLISNQDRHAGNWMIEKKTGRIIPIDHGFGFPNHVNEPGSGRMVSDLRSPFAERFIGAPAPLPHDANPWALAGQVLEGNPETWAENDLAPGDVDELRRRLERLRPEFEHLGRGKWFQFMRDRLDAIGEQATGTKSRLLPSLVD